MTPATVPFSVLAISLLMMGVEGGGGGWEAGNPKLVSGEVGARRSFKSGTFRWPANTAVEADSSAACCAKCNAVVPATDMFEFESSECRCYQKRFGVKPTTESGTSESGICGHKIDCGGHTAHTCSGCGFHPSVCGGDCEWKGRECGDKGVVLAAAGREASALSVPNPGCVEQNGIPCCPQVVVGDNTAGTEVFIKEDEIMDSCIETCKTLHSNSVGMTESLHQTYGNGKKKCWCESGEASLNQNEKNYHTCVF